MRREHPEEHLERMKRTDLDQLARDMGIQGYRKLTKPTLIQELLRGERSLRKRLKLTWWDRYHAHTYGALSVLVGVAGVALTIVIATGRSERLAQQETLFAQLEDKVRQEVSRALSSPPDPIKRPSESRIQVESLPEANAADFDVISEHIICDLRSWEYVPSIDRSKPLSPAVMRSDVRLRKRVETDFYRIPSGTSGLDIYFHAESHPDAYRVLVNDSQAKMGRYAVKERVLEIDIRSVPIGKDFRIQTSRTFWNAFQNEDQSWVGTIVREPVEEISFFLLFPESRPYKDFECLIAERGTKISVPCTGEQTVIEDPRKRFIFWQTMYPKPNHSYQIDWNW